MATKQSRADYFREYRKNAKPLIAKDAHQEGVREGIEMCCKYLREIIGQRHYSGAQVAMMVYKGTLGADLPEVIARRKLVEQMSPVKL